MLHVHLWIIFYNSVFFKCDMNSNSWTWLTCNLENGLRDYDQHQRQCPWWRHLSRTCSSKNFFPIYFPFLLPLFVVFSLPCYQTVKNGRFCWKLFMHLVLKNWRLFCFLSTPFFFFSLGLCCFLFPLFSPFFRPFCLFRCVNELKTLLAIFRAPGRQVSKSEAGTSA